ncbi:uncharacterized protein LOC129578076 [Sitodiplosis mosellana]|uniref:uncharacterized protein LOC129578076 n=1 Tax=Sitodiplosis mosellana TaxID=263140 RepID=UPI002444F219|nr:uncharacterized protein LOC129578076 [Sitodiplosis mosellana]
MLKIFLVLCLVPAIVIGQEDAAAAQDLNAVEPENPQIGVYGIANPQGGYGGGYGTNVHNDRDLEVAESANPQYGYGGYGGGRGGSFGGGYGGYGGFGGGRRGGGYGGYGGFGGGRSYGGYGGR